MTPLRSPAVHQTLVIGTRDDGDAGTVHTEAVDVGALAMATDMSVPGWRSAAVVGDVAALATLPVAGEWLGGLWAFAASDDDDIGLAPVTVPAIVRGFIGQLQRVPGGFGSWVVMAIFLGLFFWAAAIYLVVGGVALVFNGKRLTITPARVRLVAGADGFVVDAPFKLRAKLRYSRGSQSGKRKVKASLVVVGDGHEHVVPFNTPETLLRFAAAVSARGIKVSRDVKYDGVKLEQAPF